MKIFSKPLSLYEIDVLHYTSNSNDKTYFIDALIMKALDYKGNKLFDEEDRNMLYKKNKKELEKMYLEMFENEI
tara:strand:+ start:3099 stop:3320 length:222 start_codon:yes stop_codon:yes gene_type:complete